MKLKIRHQTDYHYESPVSQSVNQLCLIPRETPGQNCLSSHLELGPEPAYLNQLTDGYGNCVHKFSIDRPHKSSTVLMTSVVHVRDELPPLPESPSIPELSRKLRVRTDTESLLAHECLLPSQYVPATTMVDDVISVLQSADQSALEFAGALMSYVFNEFDYDPEFSTLVTPIEAVLKERKGVCQDFTHLCIAVLRRAGIPARYVSGYMETLPPPGQKKLQGADASHAWYSVYVPNAGWFDFDPTNNKRPDAQYATTAWGRDYSDVTPIRGVVFGGNAHEMTVAVDVDRV